MADIIFINRDTVKWNDSYDSYMINSNVGGDTEAGASLTLGSEEGLSSYSNIVSTAGIAVLTTGIEELLASSNSSTSSTAAILTLGVEEVLTSTNNNVIIGISSWIEMGLAENINASSNSVSTSVADLSLGVVEIVSSTITNTSVTAGPLITFGITELMSSTCAVQTSSVALLDLGVFELLATTSINASTADAWLQMGIPEPMTATATCVVAEIDKELTMGIETEVSSTGVIIQSTTVSLLDLGVEELLATTDPIVSTVSAAVTMGVEEDLTSTINIVSLTTSIIILGHDEFMTATASTVVPVSESGLTIGIQEATASTGAIVSTVLNSVLTMGEITLLSASFNIESTSSSFLNIGVTEVLEATVDFYSFIREGGDNANLIIGIEELLATTRASVSNVVAELTLGVDTELSRRFSNPPFTADDNTDNTVVLINFDGNTNDESGNDFDAVLQGDALLDTNGIYGSDGSVKVYEDPVLVGGSGSDLFDWGGNDFCIEVAFKDTTSTLYNNNGSGNYIIKKGAVVELNDHMAFYYTYMSNTVVRFTWTTWEDHDGFGYASDIVFEYPRSLLQNWKYVTINRINNEIFIKFNGSDNDFTYLNNANALNGWPDIKWDNLELGGFQYSISNPRFSIDALRITKDDAIYPADNFDLYQDKDVISLITADVTLGLTELLASTEDIVSYTELSELDLGVEVPMTATNNMVSNASAVTITFGVDESLSATTNIVSNTTPTLVFGIEELMASAIIGASITGLAELVFGAATPMTATGAAIVSVTCNMIETGVSESLGHTIIPVGYSGPWEDLYVEPSEYYIGSTTTALLLVGTEEILSATSTINISVSDNDLTLGVDEEMTDTIGIVSIVSASLILGTTEDLSATTGLISTTSDSLLTLGIDELLADTDHLSSTVIGELTLGVGESLGHTLYEFSSGPVDPYAVSLSTSNLVLGVDEILAVSQSTTSSTAAILTLGDDEVLTSTNNILSSFGNGDLTLGIEEDLSDECVSWTSISGLLTTGISEFMSSSIISNSVADAELTMGLSEPLAHSIITIPGQELNTGDLFIDGESVIQDENAVHTITAHNGAAVNTSQYCPQGSSLSSIYFDGDDDYISTSDHDDFDLGSGDFTIDGWYRFDSLPALQLLASKWAVLNDQRSWTLQWESSNDTLRFYWTTDGINSNVMSADWEPLIDTWYHIAVVRNGTELVLRINGDQIGSTGSITDTIFNSDSLFTIHSVNGLAYGDGYVDNFRLTKGDALWTSDFDYESNEELLYETSDPAEPYVISYTYASLTLGIDTELSATQGVISTTSDSLLSSGIFEMLASSTFSVSVTTADLILGIEEELSDDISAQSSISAILTMGVDEPLNASSTLTTSTTSLMDLGDTEYVGTSVATQSVTYASLTMGIDEYLTATSTSTNNVESLLTLGIIETASVSTTFASVTEAILTIGIEEELTAEINTSLDVSIATLTLGDDEPLTASTSIQSLVSDSDIIIGLFELLASTSITASTADATMELGGDEEMTSGCDVVSNTVAWVTMGIVESLESTAVVVSSLEVGISFGVEELLSHTSPYIFPLVYSDDLCEDGTAFGENPSARPPERAFNNLNTNYAVDAWMGDIVGDAVVGYDFGVGNEKVIQQLKIYLTSRVTNAPVNFILQGSSTQTGPWTDIYEVVNESWSSSFENKIYTFNDNKDSYQVYRLLITNSVDGIDVEIGEIELMENISELNIDALSTVSESILTIGTMEMMTSTIDPITTTSTALLDLGVSEMLASAGPIVSNAAANLTIGGGIEDLSFTCTTNVIGETGVLFIDGENIIEDENGIHTITNNGIPTISTTEVAQGNSSIYFDNSSSIEIADHTDFNFGSGNFTIDFWINAGSVVNGWIDFGGTTKFEASDASGKIRFKISTATITSNTLLNDNTWHHVAIVRTGLGVDETKLYVDGLFEDADQTESMGASGLVTLFDSSLAYVDNFRIVKGTALWTTNFDIENDLDYQGITINTYVGDSEITPSLTIGVEEELTSTINLSTEVDSLITLGIVEILGTASINVVSVDAELTLGVDEPLLSSINVVSIVDGELGIPGSLEVLEHILVAPFVVSTAYATSLDTGVDEVASAFQIIWSQIHTPDLILGVTELFTGTSNSVSVVGEPDLIAGLAEAMASTSISNSVADAMLTLGVGEVISATINVLSVSDALLSTGDDELMSSSIISTGAVAGELVFGLVEVVSATNITTSTTTAQIYAGLQEILESTVVCSSNVISPDNLGVYMMLSVTGEISTTGGLFKTT